MIHESKDGLAGNGCVDSRTQAAQHMGLHQTALAALPAVPAACRGADAGVQVAKALVYHDEKTKQLLWSPPDEHP